MISQVSTCRRQRSTHFMNLGGKASHTAIVPAAAYSSLVNLVAASGERNAVGVYGLGKVTLLADMVLIGIFRYSGNPQGEGGRK